MSGACIVAGWAFEPRGAAALALFLLFLVLGAPAAIQSMYLHPPKSFRKGDR